MAINYIQRYNCTLKIQLLKGSQHFKGKRCEPAAGQILRKQNEIENLNNSNKLQHIYLQVAIVCAGNDSLMIIILLVLRNWRKIKTGRNNG